MQWRGLSWAISLAVFGGCACAAERAVKPLVIESQGSFFVGGELEELPQSGPDPISRGGEVTVNQMYVQYQIPPRGDKHVPVVMVHGCCLSSKTWETTPDGRMGWSEYFVRRERSVYLADQAGRARSGFDPSIFAAVKSGRSPPSALPNILVAGHQFAWTIFRFGPKYPEAFSDGQFPVAAVEELYKQMIPDLSSLLPNPNPTWASMAVLAGKLHGAVLMGHLTEAAIRTGNHVLTAYEIREVGNPQGDQLRVLHDVGCMAYHARNENLSGRQLHIAPDLPLVFVTGIAGLDRVALCVDAQHQSDEVAQVRIRCMRHVVAAEADVVSDAVLRNALQSTIQRLDSQLRPGEIF
jgi:hypothetical protein